MAGVSIGFEPFTQMACAIAAGTQLTPNEVFAYEQACDYYGAERVVVQEDKTPVEGTTSPVRKSEREGTVILTLSRVRRTLTRSTMELFAYYPDVYAAVETKNRLFIYWPEVIISNEEDQSITVHDLFVRIPLYFGGLMFREREPFTILKTTFSRVQWSHGYIHSHVQNYDSFKFKHMCLGSGPIRTTISKLKMHPTDELATKLFFWELDKVMHVESLAGVPYMRMSHVVDDVATPIHNATDNCSSVMSGSPNVARKSKMLKDFLASFFRAVETPFTFRNGNYVLGCTFLDFCISISDYYNKWCCAISDMIRKDSKLSSKYRDCPSLPTRPYALLDGKLYDVRSLRARGGRPLGNEQFQFGNKTFKLTVDETQQLVYRTIVLLETGFVSEVLDFMLAAINMAVTQEYEQEEEKTAAQINYEQLRIFVSGESARERSGWATGSTSAID